MMLEQIDMHMQKYEPIHRLCTCHKHQLKVDNTPKYKMQNYRISQKKTQEKKLYDLGFGDEFVDETPKAESTKEKLISWAL